MVTLLISTRIESFLPPPPVCRAKLNDKSITLPLLLLLLPKQRPEITIILMAEGQADMPTIMSNTETRKGTGENRYTYSLYLVATVLCLGWLALNN